MPFNPQMMGQGLGPNPQMLQRQMQQPMGNMGQQRPPMQPPQGQMQPPPMQGGMGRPPQGGMDQHAEQVGRALAQNGMAGQVMGLAQQMGQGGMGGPQQQGPQQGMGPSPQMQQQMMQRRQQMMQQQRPPMMGPQGQ